MESLYPDCGERVSKRKRDTRPFRGPSPTVSLLPGVFKLGEHVYFFDFGSHPFPSPGSSVSIKLISVRTLSVHDVGTPTVWRTVTGTPEDGLLTSLKPIVRTQVPRPPLQYLQRP